MTGTNRPRAYHNTRTVLVVWGMLGNEGVRIHCVTLSTPPVGGWFAGFDESNSVVGGFGGGGTPGPIPNPVAKPSSADGTALVRVWESRTPPTSNLKKGSPPKVGSPFLVFTGVAEPCPSVGAPHPEPRRFVSLCSEYGGRFGRRPAASRDGRGRPESSRRQPSGRRPPQRRSRQQSVAARRPYERRVGPRWTDRRAGAASTGRRQARGPTVVARSRRHAARIAGRPRLVGERRRRASAGRVRTAILRWPGRPWLRQGK